MSETYQTTLGAPESEPKKAKKKKLRVVRLIVDCVLVVFFTGVIAVSSNIIYLSTEYGSSFYVNGVSMYPTLNRYALRTENGKTRYLTWNDGQNLSGDIVDWGWSKMGSKDWKSDLKRYDILVTYYKEDVKSYIDGKLILTKLASLKVKRLIAFPGETVTFEHNENNYAWGRTTVTKLDGTQEVLKELYTVNDFPKIEGHEYPEPKHYGKWTLGEDEYFLMGDNRGADFSMDSRNEGGIPSYLIQGKCYLITSKRMLVKNGLSFSTKFMLNHVRMPWNYIHLD